MPKEPYLEIVRILPAPPDEVYAAWTDAAGMRAWFCPAESITHAEAELDPRVGGKWRIAMHGEQVYVQEGEYLEVVPNRRLVMTWRSQVLEPAETRLTVEFRPHGSDETELKLVHEAFNDAANRNDYDGGWGAILEKLSQVLA